MNQRTTFPSTHLIIGLLSFAALACGHQRQIAAPTVLLEATNAIHGVGGREFISLFIRLSDDGKVEWDKGTAQGQERQIGSLSTTKVLQLERTLDSVDKSALRSPLGPYFTYVDTWVELRVRMVQRGEKLTFAVMSPWFSNTGFREKPMPRDVKVVVCQIDELRNELAGEGLDELCKQRNPTR